MRHQLRALSMEWGVDLLTTSEPSSIDTIEVLLGGSVGAEAAVVPAQVVNNLKAKGSAAGEHRRFSSDSIREAPLLFNALLTSHHFLLGLPKSTTDFNATAAAVAAHVRSSSLSEGVSSPRPSSSSSHAGAIFSKDAQSSPRLPPSPPRRRSSFSKAFGVGLKPSTNTSSSPFAPPRWVVPPLAEGTFEGVDSLSAFVVGEHISQRIDTVPMYISKLVKLIYFLHCRILCLCYLTFRYYCLSISTYRLSIEIYFVGCTETAL